MAGVSFFRILAYGLSRSNDKTFIKQILYNLAFVSVLLFSNIPTFADTEPVPSRSTISIDQILTKPTPGNHIANIDQTADESVSQERTQELTSQYQLLGSEENYQTNDLTEITLDDLVASSNGKLTGSYPDYTLHENIFVYDYLYIAPGTTILCDTSAGKKPTLVISDGRIFADGEPDSQITFTAPDNDLTDDDVTPDYWRLLEIHETSDANSIFEHCIFEKAKLALYTKSPSLQVSNSQFRNCKSGTQVYYGQATFTNCEFYNNEYLESSGAGLYVNGANIDLNLNNCNFHDNEAKWGGAINVYEANSVNILDCTIENNTAYYGGGIEVVNVIKSINMDNSTISYNQATYNPDENAGGSGGGIFIVESLNANISNCTISNNQATTGGGLYIEDVTDNTVNLNMCEIAYNSVTSGASGSNWGGGIGIWNSIVEISDCNIHDNNGDIDLPKNSNGGGVLIGSDNISLTNVLISDSNISNNSANFGGGISTFSCNASLQISNSDISNNSAVYNHDDLGGKGGGLLFENDPNVTISRSIINDNTGTRGGGIYCEGNETHSLSIIDCNIKNNSVTEGDSGSNWGGGIGFWGGSLKIVNTKLSSNQVDSSHLGVGGGVFVGSGSSPTTVEIKDSSFFNNDGYWGMDCYFLGNLTSGKITNSTIYTIGMFGIWVLDASLEILNSTAYADLYSQISLEDTADLKVCNSILWSDGQLPTIGLYGSEEASIEVKYSNVLGGWDGQGNMYSDPKFVDLNSGDFHLRNDSPCIDAGTNIGAPLADYDGESRPWDDLEVSNIVSGVDIGADERIDTDYDGVVDYVELEHNSDPNLIDTDSDGLDDYQEIYTYNTSPVNPDSDSDGLGDKWEIDHGLDPLYDEAAEDSDDDGLTNIEEFQNSCDPLNPDTDSDGITDGWEVKNSLDPLTDDSNLDPDGDGLTNLAEFQNSCDPHIADTDGDGLTDGEEVNINTNPLSEDTDLDGMPDGWEWQNYLDPLLDDSDMDYDQDGMSNYDEYLNGNWHEIHYVIDTVVDEVKLDGKLSLREAIVAINNRTSAGDARAPHITSIHPCINFSEKLMGQILYVESCLFLNNSLTIQGFGASKLSLDGQGVCRGIEVGTNGDVIIQGLKIQNCSAEKGAGLYNAGKAVVENIQLEANLASSAGGAIYNNGVLYIRDSSLVNNAVDLRLSEGGWCVNCSSEKYTLEGGAIYNNGTAALSNTTVGENWLYFEGGYWDPEPIVNLNGGGIINNDQLKLYNCTIAKNSVNSTRSFAYKGSGLASYGSTLLHNTIVSDNTPTSKNVSGAFAPQSSYNFFETIVSSSGLDSGLNIYGSPDLPLSAGLLDLDTYGGETFLYKLEKSAAIDAGHYEWAVYEDGSHLQYDQRGESYNRILRERVDIGAYESNIQGELFPDLILEEWENLPNILATDSNLEVSSVCKNVGWAKADVADSNSITISLFMADNPDIDWERDKGQLELISKCNVAELVTMERQRFNINLHVPSNEGQYYYRAKIDEPNNLNETDELNNWSEVIIINAIPFEGGDGTWENPYLISTTEQFNQIRNEEYNEKHYMLIDDIDFGGTDFESIESFSGSLDGAGHAVSNFTGTGLFDTIEIGASVSNLRLLFFDLSVSNRDESVAPLSKYNNGNIQNCMIDGRISVLTTSGGMVYKNQSNGKIENCYSFTNVIARHFNCGCEWNGSGWTCISCWRGGVGGLVGYNQGAISNCYYAGKFDLSSISGGAGLLVGIGESTASFYNSEINDFNNSDSGIPATTSEMKIMSLYIDAGWDFDNVWQLNCQGQSYPTLQGIEDLSQYCYEGNGTAEDPFQIKKPLDICALSYKTHDVNTHFVLSDDIDMNEVNLQMIPEFKGVFNGNGHCIKNLSNQEWGGEYTGFIRQCSGVIQNIEINNWDINPSGRSAGLICGDLTGTLKNIVIEDCNLICDSEHTRYAYAGAFCGFTSGLIEKCTVENTRIESHRQAGGIVGFLWGAQVMNCSAINCIILAEQSAGIAPRGFDGRISNCYSTCIMPDSEESTGIAGSGMTVENSFWDGDVFEVTTSGLGEEKTTQEMQMLQTYTDAGWDFIGETTNGTEDIWSICEGTNYPKLSWQIEPTDFVCPDGTGSEDLSLLANRWLCTSNDSEWDKVFDVFQDEVINLKDFAVFAEHWLE